jgi:pimeloyl-ACP methyl ester carboxylesterase
MNNEVALNLPDGRKLSYAEFGKPDGFPVFYFHATPSSRLEPLFLGDDIFSRLGMRVICPDRPGIGNSSFQENRSLSDWPEDVKFLSQNLGLNQISILGISGGGAYAAVCAARIPEQLSKVVVASGSWRIDSEAVSRIGFPMNLMWQVTRYTPVFLPVIIKTMARMMSQPPNGRKEKTSAPQNDYFPAADNAVMAQPGRLEKNQRIMQEVLRQGTRGAVWDFRLCVRDWDFELSEIQMPFFLFHGELDRNYPVELTREVANELPQARLHTYPEDGHLSTYSNHFEDIARALLPE